MGFLVIGSLVITKSFQIPHRKNGDGNDHVRANCQGCVGNKLATEWRLDEGAKLGSTLIA